MSAARTGSVSAVAVWSIVAVCLAVPVIAAAYSPLLAWRSPVYVAAGFSGVVALALLLIQPLLITGRLPGLPMRRARSAHRFVGCLLLLLVAFHVAGLWITSPPDVVDALLFVSPTPFSHWGVIAMWAVIGTTFLTLFRKRLGMTYRTWRRAHYLFAILIVGGSVLHAVLIEGAMESLSKFGLCALIVFATIVALAKGAPKP